MVRRSIYQFPNSKWYQQLFLEFPDKKNYRVLINVEKSSKLVDKFVCCHLSTDFDNPTQFVKKKLNAIFAVHLSFDLDFFIAKRENELKMSICYFDSC